MVVSKDEAIYGKKDGDHKGRVDQVVKVGGSWDGEQTSEEVELMVREGCHGEQYLSTGMTQRYLIFMVNGG